jgi:Protein of unknown function (DUF3048) C-terminal domain/Protein of unknown function (DUF3048) N-terminal domain
MARAQPARPSRLAGSGLAAAAGLAVAACAASAPNLVGAGPVPAGPVASHAAGAAGKPRTPAPLTDLAAASAAGAQRRAVALVLSGPDPRGLTSADVVYQEFAAPVRYIAVFQSKEATGVGPLASTQPTDGQALSVLRPLFGYDGSTPVFTKELHHTHVTDVGFSTHRSLYARAAGGVTASTRAIRRAVRGSEAPPEIFYYRGQGTGTNVLATDHLSRPAAAKVIVPAYGTESWAYDSRTGLWALTAGGPRVRVANVVVQMVPYKQAVVSHRAGTTVPSARLIGTGTVQVLSGSAGGSGTAAPGTWSKPHLNQLTDYTDGNGYPMAFQPGPTWVIFAPKGTRFSTSGGK